MTSRLVGLMSLVLLLCLAAFAFLLNHYQNQVMDEVAHTISTVGQQTLRTLDHHGLHDVEAVVDEFYGMHEIARRFEPPAEGEGEERTMRVVTSAHSLPRGGVQGVLVFSRGGETPVVRHFGEGDEDPVCTTTDDLWVTQFEGKELPVRPQETEILMTATATAARERLFIRVEDISTESGSQEIMLRIPTWRQEENKFFAAPPEMARADDANMTPVSGQARVPLHQESIVLPISTDDYEALFSSFRRRSVFLLLGVFVLGTVLSASLASRFTRPVRRLDAGIRRLSEGDLDVKVETRGRDEIARLGRAFNEMARRLKSGRDRERVLNRREKLSALGRLAAGVAHDVRNPLHSINLTLQHLQETCRPRETARGVEFDRSLGIIREEIRRLSRLVENFLRFARSDRQEKAPVHLPKLLRETVQLVEKEAGRRGVEVEVRIDDAIPDVMADAESVRSSVLNLVLNSFEAMPEGGRLTLSARREGGDVLVEVADSGAGIPAEEQERVFEFAYTTREGGHGLGLPMVHQVVVEDHGGRVSLESRPGAGTRVLLAFPASEGTTA